MNKSVYLCSNIYECGMASGYLLAQPIPVNLTRCILCSGDSTVLKVEARDLIAACPICSKINGIEHGDKTLHDCLKNSSKYCPYCNCEYPIDTDQKNDSDIAMFLKIFIGKRLITSMQEDINKMIRMPLTEPKGTLGCEGLCNLMKDALARMNDNDKKRRLIQKIRTTIEPMTLLEFHCADCLVEK